MHRNSAGWVYEIGHSPCSGSARFSVGGPSRTRTLDPLIKSRVGHASRAVPGHHKSTTYAGVSVPTHPQNFPRNPSETVSVASAKQRPPAFAHHRPEIGFNGLAQARRIDDASYGQPGPLLQGLGTTGQYIQEDRHTTSE